MKFGPGQPLAYPIGVTIGALAVCLAWAPFAYLDQLAALATVGLAILGYTGFQLAIALGLVSNGLADIYSRRADGTNAARGGAGKDPNISDADTRSSDDGSSTPDAATGGDIETSGTDAGSSAEAGTGSIGGRSTSHSDEARTVEIKRLRQQHRLVSRSWLEITENYRTRWLPVFFDPALVELTETEAKVTGRSVDTTTIHFYPSGRARAAEPPGRLIDNPSRLDPDAPVLATDSARLRRRLLLDAQSTVAAPFVALMWVYVAAGGFVAFLAATSVAAATAIWLAAIRGSDPS
ncbi:hypothetical protein OG874_34680 [Nocardia sp. NBC_00565]|nr:hypothetical protein [Nocardia sp. NBC_00565]WUC01857.1 hypothetical protein OG874_34680 [Nocardia sp. NBC_00565]